MKTSMNQPLVQISPAILAKGQRADRDLSNQPNRASGQIDNSTRLINDQKPRISHRHLLTRTAISEMIIGNIPDLWEPCIALFRSLHTGGNPNSALQFIPVLSGLSSHNQNAMERFKRSSKTSCVLVDNDLLKVVLIHWPPGKIGSIHGHPAGGGVFKILQGSVEELRYTKDVSPKLLGTSTYHSGSIAYIDDTMGYHAVGNPFNTSAISLHAYTRGTNLTKNA